MFGKYRRRLIRRYAWLNPANPIAVRDIQWTLTPLPPFFQRLTNVWSLFGHAALIHGIMFVVSVITYNHLNTTLAGALIPVLAPFLTPFGTPIAAGMIHTLLYWSMMVGICAHATFVFSREMSTGSWDLLRLTPYSPSTIALTKVVTVWRAWFPILRVMFWIRAISLLIIPIGLASLRARDVPPTPGLNLASVLLFLVQPFADAALVLGVGSLVGAVVHNPLWAKVYALGVVAVISGGAGFVVSLVMTLTSPIGPLSALLAPMAHWSPLVAASLPASSAPRYGFQIAMLWGMDFIIPAAVGIGALFLLTRRMKLETA